jgi:leucyl/phenylalanyl-tRNA--protein transferase
LISRVNNQAPFWIDPNDTDTPFPDPGLALREPNGLLAIGGDLSAQRLMSAYRSGIFPWYNEGQPVLWWSPDPRLVIYSDELKLSRSLRKALAKHRFQLTMDQAFTAVIEACAQPRQNSEDTWISPDMIDAYCELYRLGFAHSVEAWQDNSLVGGLYGVGIGRMFFGESMFTRVNDASKIAFVSLVRQLSAWGFPLIDCQVYTRHLASFGARLINRRAFIVEIGKLCQMPAMPSPWTFNDNRPGQTG